MAINTQLRRGRPIPPYFTRDLRFVTFYAPFTSRGLFLEHSFLYSSIAILALSRIHIAYSIYSIYAARFCSTRAQGGTTMLIASRRSVIEYRVVFDRVSLRGIPEGGIVSREEVEIQLGLRLERNSMLEVPSSCVTRCTVLTSGTSVRKISLAASLLINLSRISTVCTLRFRRNFFF